MSDKIKDENTKAIVTSLFKKKCIKISENEWYYLGYRIVKNKKTDYIDKEDYIPYSCELNDGEFIGTYTLKECKEELATEPISNEAFYLAASVSREEERLLTSGRTKEFCFYKGYEIKKDNNTYSATLVYMDVNYYVRYGNCIEEKTFSKCLHSIDKEVVKQKGLKEWELYDLYPSEDIITRLK